MSKLVIFIILSCFLVTNNANATNKKKNLTTKIRQSLIGRSYSEACNSSDSDNDFEFVGDRPQKTRRRALSTPPKFVSQSKFLDSQERNKQEFNNLLKRINVNAVGGVILVIGVALLIKTLAYN
ncbi:MAG: hypothetical protein P4L22_03030 [Candidatus Babeliales bacterium]|nr:hypothetical protein [Candidatus Babeliales bacterium]